MSRRFRLTPELPSWECRTQDKRVYGTNVYTQYGRTELEMVVLLKTIRIPTSPNPRTVLRGGGTSGDGNSGVNCGVHRTPLRVTHVTNMPLAFIPHSASVRGVGGTQPL